MLQGLAFRLFVSWLTSSFVFSHKKIQLLIFGYLLSLKIVGQWVNRFPTLILSPKVPLTHLGWIQVDLFFVHLRFDQWNFATWRFYLVSQFSHRRRRKERKEKKRKGKEKKGRKERKGKVRGKRRKWVIGLLFFLLKGKILILLDGGTSMLFLCFFLFDILLFFSHLCFFVFCFFVFCFLFFVFCFLFFVFCFFLFFFFFFFFSSWKTPFSTNPELLMRSLSITHPYAEKTIQNLNILCTREIKWEGREGKEEKKEGGKEGEKEEGKVQGKKKGGKGKERKERKEGRENDGGYGRFFVLVSRVKQKGIQFLNDKKQEIPIQVFYFFLFFFFIFFLFLFSFFSLPFPFPFPSSLPKNPLSPPTPSRTSSPPSPPPPLFPALPTPPPTVPPLQKWPSELI